MNIAVAQPEQETTAPPLCDHCGLEVPPALREEQVELQFCCSGCRVAYEVINDCGLEDFYSVRESAQRGKQRSSGVATTPPLTAKPSSRSTRPKRAAG